MEVARKNLKTAKAKKLKGQLQRMVDDQEGVIALLGAMGIGVQVEEGQVRLYSQSYHKHGDDEVHDQQQQVRAMAKEAKDLVMLQSDEAGAIKLLKKIESLA